MTALRCVRGSLVDVLAQFFVLLQQFVLVMLQASLNLVFHVALQIHKRARVVGNLLFQSRSKLVQFVLQAMALFFFVVVQLSAPVLPKVRSWRRRWCTPLVVAVLIILLLVLVVVLLLLVSRRGRGRRNRDHHVGFLVLIFIVRVVITVVRRTFN
jgi:hypothetical protein